MIKSIRMKNFKSFGNCEISFVKSNNQVKKLLAIYGENGSGKSNLISTMAFLMDSIKTLTYKDLLKDLIEKTSSHDIENNDYKSVLEKLGQSLQEQIKISKTIDSDENMELEYHLLINNKEAIYTMIFDDESIIYETLKYPLEKNMTEVFAVSKDNVKFNQGLFKDSKFKSEIKDNINAYFGKNTFLAILYAKFESYNKAYLHEKINEAVFDFFEEIFSISILYKNGNHETNFGDRKSNLLTFLSEGTIDKKDLPILKASQEALNTFFTSLYSDIKSVSYKTKENENSIAYQLQFNKMIDGKIRAVPYNLESTGTTKLLAIFPLIYDCINGKTVFIDEIDAGTHDLLMVNLMEIIDEQITGQLVFTTHNTLLLQHMKTDYAYVISSDINGQKQINCIKAFGRIQGNHNVTDQYLKGVYGGIPVPGYLDLFEIVEYSKKFTC